MNLLEQQTTFFGNSKHLKFILKAIEDKSPLEWNNFVKLQGSSFKADLRGINLKACNLSELNLERALLDLANFEGCNCTWTNLKGASLKGVNFEGALMEKAFIDKKLEKKEKPLDFAPEEIEDDVRKLRMHQQELLHKAAEQFISNKNIKNKQNEEIAKQKNKEVHKIGFILEKDHQDDDIGF